MRPLACLALVLAVGGCPRSPGDDGAGDLAVPADLAVADLGPTPAPDPVPSWTTCGDVHDGGIELAPDLAAPASGATEAPNFRIDAAHTGAQPRETLTPPLSQAWSLDLGGNVNYALVADGRVFATAGGGWPVPGVIVAADVKTGAVLWGPQMLGNNGALAAYDNGRVFALEGGGLLVALDAATGQTVWTRQLTGENFFQVPPVTDGGLVYVEGIGFGGIIYAVDERNGDVLWESETFDGSQGTVAVWNGIVYDSESCVQVYAFDGRTGALQWHHCTHCAGGGGTMPTAYGGRLYVREDPYFQNDVLDLLTGADVTTLPMPRADGALSIQDGRAFLLSFVNGAGQLRAVDLASGTEPWGIADLNFAGSPLAAGGYVYAGFTNRTLEAFDAATGNVVWTATVDAAINSSPEYDSMTVAEGTLFVPVGHTLVAYR